jgi:flagellar hook-length control protein FliK
MRINPDLASSASGSHSSRPAERVDPNTAFSFFAQIDQIQNLQHEPDSRRDTSSGDDNPDKPGQSDFLSTILSFSPLPSGPFPTPDQPENPADSSVTDPCQSSETGDIFPESRFAAAAAKESMNGGSFAALILTQVQNSNNPQIAAQPSSQPPDTSTAPARDDSTSLPSRRDNEIELNGIAQDVEKTGDRSGDAAIERTGRQNPPPQSQSNGIAQILGKMTDLSGAPPAEAGRQNPSPQSLSNGIAQILLERTMQRSGAPVVQRMQGQNGSAQSSPDGIDQVFERIEDRSDALTGAKDTPEPGIRSQLDPSKVRPSESHPAGSIPADPEMRALFSKIVTISAPDKSGDSGNSPGPGGGHDTRGGSYGATAPEKANASAAPQNDEGAGSRPDRYSGPKEPGIAGLAQTKSNAVRTEIPSLKPETNANRQEVFSHDLFSNAQPVDSTLKPGSSSAPEPARPQNLILQIAERIQIQVRDGGGEIRVQLKPEGLGQLEIKAETTVNGVAARISTDSDGMKSYLENNLHLLQQALQDQGLKVDQIYVTVQNGSDDQTSSSHTAQFSHAGHGQHGKEPQNPQRKPQVDRSDVLEEMTVDPATWRMLKPNTRFHTVA